MKKLLIKFNKGKEMKNHKQIKDDLHIKIRKLLLLFIQKTRYLKYKILSDCRRVDGNPIIVQPMLLVGAGKIIFNKRVIIGVPSSPYCFNGYTYIEARSESSIIEFGDGVILNNNCIFISDGPGISIGRNTMIGWNCEIYDSDFHNINPSQRDCYDLAKKGRVIIGENVMIGSNVKILRGVSIGDNSVVSNGAVVSITVPANSLVYGNPAKGGILPNAEKWKINKE